MTEFYDYLKATGEFSTLADLKEILVKTQKIRDTYEKDRMPLSGLSEFVLLYALVHPEAENALVKLSLLPPNYVATYRKYEYPSEEGPSDS